MVQAGSRRSSSKARTAIHRLGNRQKIEDFAEDLQNQTAFSEIFANFEVLYICQVRLGECEIQIKIVNNVLSLFDILG